MGGRGRGGIHYSRMDGVEVGWGTFWIDMSIIRTYVISLVHPSGGGAIRSAVLHGKNCNVGHYTQTVQPDCLIPAMLKGFFDFYHFIPLSLTLTLPVKGTRAQGQR